MHICYFKKEFKIVVGQQPAMSTHSTLQKDKVLQKAISSLGSKRERARELQILESQR